MSSMEPTQPSTPAPARGGRLAQIVLIISTLALSWLLMQAVHELGHVCGAWLTGGQVERVVLHPLAFSRTDVAPNPHPLIVTWSGPIIGVALPLAAFTLARGLRLPGWYIVRFIAGFCLIANGAYLGVGAFDRAGDAGDLLRHGAPIWTLWLFGLLTVPPGFYLWHRLGPHFALASRSAAGPASVHTLTAWLTLAALVVIVLVELLLGGFDSTTAGRFP